MKETASGHKETDANFKKRINFQFFVPEIVFSGKSLGTLPSEVLWRAARLPRKLITNLVNFEKWKI